MIWALTLALGALGAAGAGAQDAPAVVTAQAVGTANVYQGGQALAQIKVTVADGYHVQANPASQDNLIATTAELKGGQGLKTGKAVYPAGKAFTPAEGGPALSVYDGAFSIQIPLKAASGAQAGGRSLEGTLKYQACDAKACLFPQTLSFSVPVSVLQKAKN